MSEKLSALVNIGELVTCEGEKGLNIIEEAALIFNEESGRITELGREETLRKKYDFSDITGEDMEGRPVLPGFIDPHTHFVFGGYRAEEYFWRLQGMSYLEIMEKGGGISSTVRATRESSFEELYRRGWQRLDSFLAQGVTTIEGKSGYGMELETELKQLEVMKKITQEHPVDVVQTFLGAHIIPGEFQDSRQKYIDILINRMLPAAAERDEIEFCDVFCDKGVYTVEETEKILLAAQKLGLKSKIHVDEIEYVGGAELAAKIGAVSAEHLLKVSDRGISEMEKAGVIPVILPITAFSLQESYAPARKMADRGLPVALATDLNPGSCYSESFPLLLALATLKLNLTPEEAIRAVTINAARAINREEEIGSLKAGKKADFTVLDAPDYRHLIYHIGVNSVCSVYKSGKKVKQKEKSLEYI